MYRDINEEIYDLKQRLRVKEKLESSRDMVNLELNKSQQKLKVLKYILGKEEKHVTKLEGMSINAGESAISSLCVMKDCLGKANSREIK